MGTLSPTPTTTPVPWVHGLTVGEALRTTATRYPDHDALVFPGLNLRWSWRELDRRVDSVASGLIRQGVARGEHVGIWSMNAPEWVVAQFAIARIGSVLVNINPAYRLHELESTLRLSDISSLIVGCSFKGSNFIEMVQTLCAEVAQAESRAWRSDRFPELRRVVSVGSEEGGGGWLRWSELEGEPHPDLPSRIASAQYQDVYNIQFTSGTTGLPKGAMLSHANVLMNAFYVGQRVRYGPDDRVCVPVPFYHCFGCVLGTLVCAVTGAALVVPAPSFDPGLTLKAIDSERCTSIYGVPTMFVAELDHPDFDRFDLSHLRTGIMAGSPCPLPLMRAVMSRMGANEITIGYGQTEASPIITQTSVDDPIEVRVGTVGSPIPGVEVQIVDPSTRVPVEPGEAGELRVRGHCVMAGYYKEPGATSKVIDADGWLHTGDLARQREDGNFRIVGRSKELIIRGGENIYPPEIEEFLHHHPEVADVAVLGLPDPKYGEVVSAWIVAKPQATLTEQGVRDYCRGQIAHFKIPHYVRIVTKLPKTVTGKIRKVELREEGILHYKLEASRTIPTA